MVTDSKIMTPKESKSQAQSKSLSYYTQRIEELQVLF